MNFEITFGRDYRKKNKIKEKLANLLTFKTEREKEQVKKYGIYFGVFEVITLYFSLHLAKFLYPITQAPTSGQYGVGSIIPETQNVTFVDALTKAIANMTSDPLNIFPFQWKFLIPFGIISLIGLGAIFMIYYRERLYWTSLPLDEIQGSAKFFENIEKNYKPNFERPYEAGGPDKYVFDENMIFADGLKMDIDNKRVNRNKNVLVVGGPGTGKSFMVVKPNLMQYNCSTITTDPSGELMMCCAKAQMDRGIRIKLFSTSDMKHSNKYNPFDYIYDENGDPDDTKISTMIYLFLSNADGAKQKGGDPFWTKSAKALLTAIVYYLLEEKRDHPECLNFNTVLKMVQQGKVSEESNASESQLDRLMNEAREHAKNDNRNSKAWSNYATFKLATGKTANSILITCAVDLQLFDNDDVKVLTSTDLEDDNVNLHLEKLGYEQTALYINIPQANGTYAFLVSLMYSQLFDTLYTHAEKICPKKWMLTSKYGFPILAGFNSEKEAEETKEKLLTATIRERKNKRGVITYEICNGKKVITDNMSRAGAEKILELAKDAIVEKGTARGDNRLPWHVRCLMDEFANIGEVPEFAEKLTTMRKYEISCTIIVQSISQLKSRYKESYETIIGGCDTIIFLGSSENDTCEYVSKLLGDTTVRTKNLSVSSKGGSSSFSYQKRPLRTPAEVKKLDNSECYVFIRGLDPFHVKKYSFANHEHFKESSHGGNPFSTEMLDTYFRIGDENKKNGLRNKQKASKVRNTVIIQPEDEKEVLSAFNAKTVDEAKANTNIPPITEKNKKNMEEKVINDGTKTITTSTAAVELDDDGGFLF